MESQQTTATVTTAESATPSVGHLHHIDPTAGPTELSAKHPNIVNYAISVGGVLVGVTLITTFVLICRWRKRRKQRALDDQIDNIIHEAAIAHLAASRTSSLAKLPPAAMQRGSSHLRPLSLLTYPSLSQATTSTLATLPRPPIMISPTSGHRSTSDSDTIAPHPSTHFSSSSPTETSSILARVSTTEDARSIDPNSRLRLPAALRPRSRTDENTHRVPSRSRGIGIGIMVATTTGSIVCPSSPAPTTPSLVFSTPPLGTSVADSPALSFSDDAGSTTLSPIALTGERLDPECAITSPNARNSVELAAAQGHLGSALAHMQVSPLVRDRFGSPSSSSGSSPASSPHNTGINHWQKPSLSVIRRAFRSPEESGKNALEAKTQGQGEGESERWFTEVDWFGVDGPLPLEYFDQPPSTAWSTRSRVAV